VMDDEFAERRNVRLEGTGEGGALLIRYVNDWRSPSVDLDE